MKKTIHLVILSLSFILINSGCGNNQTKEEKKSPSAIIDFKLFFKNPEKAGFKISKDGNYFSYRADYKGKMNIFVQKVGDTTAVRVTTDTLRSIGGYFWKGTKIIYSQDVGGDENFQVFSVSPDGSNLNCLTPFPGFRTDIIDVLDFVKGKEDELIVGNNKRKKEIFDPYSLNIQTGKLTQLYDNKGNYDSWVTDNSGVIRIATKTDGVNITYNYRSNDKEPFKELLTTSYKESFSPASFDAANKNIYLLTNIGRDKVVLAEYDPITKKEVKEIYSNPDYDLGGVNFDRQKNVLVSVSWDAEKAEEHFFDKEWEAVDADLKSKFKGYETYITSYDDSRSKAIVGVYNDRQPSKFYLYDFATKETKEVANAYPWLQEDQLAEMKPVTYQTRDGLAIQCFLPYPVLPL